MDEQVRAEFEQAIADLEAGNVPLRRASQILESVEKSIMELEAGLKIGDKTLEDAEGTTDKATVLLAGAWKCLKKLRGRRDEEAQSLRQELNKIVGWANEAMRQVSHGTDQTRHVALVAMTQLATLREAENYLYANDWKQAAERIRQNLQQEDSLAVWAAANGLTPAI